MNQPFDLKPLFPMVVMLLILGPAATVTGQSQQRAPQDGDRELLKGFLVEGGRLNIVAGEVERISGSNAVGALKSNQTFENGDRIQSGASGRAEILLIPGYYLRLDHNTRISLLNLAAENLKLKLWSGSAILEVATRGSFPSDQNCKSSI